MLRDPKSRVRSAGYAREEQEAGRAARPGGRRRREPERERGAARRGAFRGGGAEGGGARSSAPR